MLQKEANRLLRWALVLLWMAVIFWASAQGATASSSLSGSLIEKIAAIVNPNFNQMNPMEQAAIVEQFQYIVRKTAHLSEYAVLGLLISLALDAYSIARSKKFCMTLGISVLYAISDEIHQYFVPGRSAQFSDVAIDFCGAMLGVGLFCVVIVLRQRYSS